MTLGGPDDFSHSYRSSKSEEGGKSGLVPKIKGCHKNKLQKLEDALFEQMLTAADLAYRIDQGDRGDELDEFDEKGKLFELDELGELDIFDKLGE